MSSGAWEKLPPKWQALILTLSVSFVTDWLTKFWVERTIDYGDRVHFFDGLVQITHVRNPGAAFGWFLAPPTTGRTALFLGVSVLAVSVVTSYFQRLAPGDRYNARALALILGGTLGNLADRLLKNGEVTDFLHIRLWTGYRWPDFNFADVFIVLGVGSLIVELMTHEASSRAHRASAVDEDGGR